MRTLLAILSCRRDLPLEMCQRTTFLQNCPMDYRFFHGRSHAQLPTDAVRLDVEDDFANLPFKTQAMCRWALEQGYDFVFKTDTDTYIRIDRLLSSGFESYDYSGYFNYEPGPGAYASGGSGYWLSAAAMRIVSAAQMHVDNPNWELGNQSTRGEDLQICWALRDSGIHCHKDDRYRLRYPGPLPLNLYITLHDVMVGEKHHRIPKAHFDWVRNGGRQ